MKNLLITLSLFFCFLTAGMSQFHFGAGAQLVFDGSVFGIQGKALYEINNEWRAVGGFTYHLEDGVDYTIDLDAQYKAVEISDNFDFALLAGIGLTNFAFGSDTGINLGAFFDFTLDGGTHIYAEPKIVLDGLDGFVLSGGIMF